MNTFRTACLIALATFAACSSPPETGPSAGAEVVGTYDPRAVCIAYANGPRFQQWISALKQEHDAAEAAGDTDKAKALEAKAEAQQERFHGQAFSGDDVDDILALVADALPKICAEAGVARLEKVNKGRPAGVATVDVTERLVDLFEPSEKGRGWIAELKERPLR